MNIFFTSDSPVHCAEYLDDKRVVKMCLETAQMLCTAINESGNKAPYKSTHKNHPSCKWVRESQANFEWTRKHFVALCWEYKKRYGKIHKSFKVIIDEINSFKDLPDIGLTPIPNCAANKEKGLCYKDIPDTILAYKMYLNDRWDTDTRTPTWYGEVR